MLVDDFSVSPLESIQPNVANPGTSDCVIRTFKRLDRFAVQQFDILFALGVQLDRGHLTELRHEGLERQRLARFERLARRIRS